MHTGNCSSSNLDNGIQIQSNEDESNCITKSSALPEVIQLRVEDLPKPNIFGFHELGSSLLILGDGNLTFSLVLCRACPQKKITATIFEDQNEWKDKYGSDGLKILTQLENSQNVTLIFGVDATRLEDFPFCRNSFSDIIFNFPHQGGKTNLKKSRELIRQIFASVARNVMGLGNRFHLTLAQGQSGLDPNVVNEGRYFTSEEEPKHNKDSWMPLELGAEFGLVAMKVARFDSVILPGYTSSGYMNAEQGFDNTGDAHTITFRWIGHLTRAESMRPSVAMEIEIAGQYLRTPSFIEPTKSIYHQFRPYFNYHMSVVFGRSQSNEQKYMEELQVQLFRLIRQIAGPFLVHLTELEDKRCVAPQNLQNRIYLLRLQGLAVPLYRELANAIQHELCYRLDQIMDEMRTDIRIVTQAVKN